MIRRPPRSTLSSSSAASDVYKRQVWEELAEIEELARAGAAVQVRGRYTVHPRFGPQINLRGLEAAAPGSYDPGDLLDGPAHGVEQMEGEVRDLLATIQEPHLRILLE